MNQPTWVRNSLLPIPFVTDRGGGLRTDALRHAVIMRPVQVTAQAQQHSSQPGSSHASA